MYAFLDRPVSDLDQGGRFLVWSMRSWVRAMSTRTEPAQALGPAFARWNASQGLRHFQLLMQLFNRSGRETFQFCAIPCNHVSEHEALILSLICARRRNLDADSVRETVAMLIERDRIADMLNALDELGTALETAGIFPASRCVRDSAAN